MKKIYYLAFVILALGFMAHTYNPASGLSNVIISFLGAEPDLPDTPFDYGVSIPDHLLNPPQDTFGYGAGTIDTTLLPLIGDETATLGRVLFYDKSLSANEDISCGSCHLQSHSFADDKIKSVGVSTPTHRNSMQLNDLGWSNNSSFFWDKKKKDLFDAVELPLKDKNEVGATLEDMLFKMGQSTFYPQLFEDAYGDSEVTEERILNALAQFINSINSFNSKFDRVNNGDGKFTQKEAEGSVIFAQGCAFCHVQGNRDFIFGIEPDDLILELIFTYNGYNANDDDYGAMDTSIMKLPLFKMPTLRNIELTAPYMHDGGIPDLDSLINFYSHGVEDHDFSELIPPGGLQFTSEQKEALKAFLLTLTDESMAKEEKWSDPFGLSNNTNDGDLGAVVTIAPNPFDQIARVKVGGYDNIRKDITITTISGSRVQADYFIGDEYTIMRDQLSSGVYIITIRCDNKFGSYKLMVQ